MKKVLRTNAENHDFIELVQLLDTELSLIDGEEHSFYSQFNKIDHIKHVIVLYEDDKPVGCGAMKEYSSEAMELKRMFVLPENRNRGLATMIVTELETWALEISYTKCVLETGVRQPDAIALYKKNGYKLIPNWGQYVGVENSVCFEKKLI
jgi:putative acetyltransferase